MFFWGLVEAFIGKLAITGVPNLQLFLTNRYIGVLLFVSKNAFQGIKLALEKRNFIANSVLTNRAISFTAKTKNTLLKGWFTNYSMHLK